MYGSRVPLLLLVLAGFGLIGDTLKVDRSFVEGLPQDEQAVALVRGLVALAKRLHLTVTGEGIEMRQQLVSLQESDNPAGYSEVGPTATASVTSITVLHGSVKEGD